MALKLQQFVTLVKARRCKLESRLEQESKQTNGSNDFDRKLPTPHFDDEATLLSARPVVPFHELAERSPKRRLYFGAGLVLAAAVGLLGGIFYARMETTPALQSETATATTALQEELVSTGEAPTEAPTESVEEAAVPANTTTVTVEGATRIPRPSRHPVRIADKSGSRPARTFRREPSRHRQTSDDLFRIQEIFEGSSRP